MLVCHTHEGFLSFFMLIPHACSFPATYSALICAQTSHNQDSFDTCSTDNFTSFIFASQYLTGVGEMRVVGHGGALDGTDLDEDLLLVQYKVSPGQVSSLQLKLRVFLTLNIIDSLSYSLNDNGICL